MYCLVGRPVGRSVYERKLSTFYSIIGDEHPVRNNRPFEKCKTIVERISNEMRIHKGTNKKVANVCAGWEIIIDKIFNANYSLILLESTNCQRTRRFLKWREKSFFKKHWILVRIKFNEKTSDLIHLTTNNAIMIWATKIF